MSGDSHRAAVLDMADRNPGAASILPALGVAVLPPASTAAAERLYVAGRYAEAAEQVRALAEEGQEDALGLLGLCQLRQGDLVAALASLERAVERAPENGLLTLRYGLALQAAGRHARAVALFRKADARLPSDPAPMINLCNSYVALGRHGEAVRVARRAVRRAPGLAAAHYALGRAQAETERPAEAVRAFREAVRLEPAFTEAWVALGAALYRQGDLSGAEQATRRALQLAPEHEGAVTNLVSFLRLTGRSEACVPLLQRLLAKNPSSPLVRAALVGEFLQSQRPRDALDLLQGPSPAEPKLRLHWRLQHSLSLLQVGRPGDARPVLEAIRAEPIAPSLLPLLRWRELLLAPQEDRPCLAEDLAGLLHRTVGMLPEHRLIAWYDLARFWSYVPDPGRAMRCWREGHALLARLQPFDRATTAEWFDTMHEAFDQTRLTSGPVAVNEDPAPVFIVGMPRSGTTLCEQILAAHPMAFGAGERGAMQEAFMRLGGDDTAAGVRRVAAAPQSALDETAWDALHAMHKLAPDRKRIVDKMPANFRLCGLIALLFPRAKIINCVRDPRDIGLSIFTYRFYGYHPYAHDLSDLGWYIAQERRMMAHWSAVLPGRVLPVRLSDWVSDFDGTLRRVLDHVGLPWDDACRTFYESKAEVRTVSRNQVRQPVNARGLGRWRPYAAELAPLIAELEKADVLQANGWASG